MTEKTELKEVKAKLEQLLADLKKGDHDQSEWLHPCGSPSCVAGFIAVRNPKAEVFDLTNRRTVDSVDFRALANDYLFPTIEKEPFERFSFKELLPRVQNKPYRNPLDSFGNIDYDAELAVSKMIDTIEIWVPDILQEGSTDFVIELWPETEMSNEEYTALLKETHTNKGLAEYDHFYRVKTEDLIPLWEDLIVDRIVLVVEVGEYTLLAEKLGNNLPEKLDSDILTELDYPLE